MPPSYGPSLAFGIYSVPRTTPAVSRRIGGARKESGGSKDLGSVVPRVQLAWKEREKEPGREVMGKDLLGLVWTDFHTFHFLARHINGPTFTWTIF